MVSVLTSALRVPLRYLFAKDFLVCLWTLQTRTQLSTSLQQRLDLHQTCDLNKSLNEQPKWRARG